MPTTPNKNKNEGRNISAKTATLDRMWLYFRRVQGTKRTNQEQRLYTQRSVKTRLSTVQSCVNMCVNGALVWTWVTDYSVSLCTCECMLCAFLNSVRFATNDFCLHKTGFKIWMYVASRKFKWCFDRQRASTLKSVALFVIFTTGALQESSTSALHSSLFSRNFCPWFPASDRRPFVNFWSEWAPALLDLMGEARIVLITSWYTNLMKAIWLATHLYLQNDWTGLENGVNYDVIAQAPVRIGAKPIEERLYVGPWVQDL